MLSLIAVLSLSVIDPPSDDATQPGAQQPAVLAGPSVDAAAVASPATLVERDFAGALIRLEVRPEAAALTLLALAEEETAAATKVLDARAVLIHQTLQEHLDLFLEVQGARQADDRAALRELMPRFREAVSPLVNPRLVDQICDTVQPEHAKEIRRLVDEYTTALAQETSAGAPTSARESRSEDQMEAEPERQRRLPRVERLRDRIRIDVALIVREMAQSLSATVADRRERLEDIVNAAGATPEQAEKIRQIIRSRAEGAGELSQEDRAESMRLILAELTPEQRRSLFKHLRESAGPAPKQEP